MKKITLKFEATMLIYADEVDDVDKMELTIIDEIKNTSTDIINVDITKFEVTDIR